MYIKARYANRIELEYDLHLLPNNFHEPNHLIPFCLLWSVLKVQPVHRRKTLVSDKVKSSFFGKSGYTFEIKVIHSVLFCPFPGCNISCSTDSFPHQEAGIIKFIKVAIVERGEIRAEISSSSPLFNRVTAESCCR